MADDAPLETLVRRVGRALDKDELDEPDDLLADERFGEAVEQLLAEAPEDLPVTRGRAVVRRYRREPSPLVRDAARGRRTGRLDRVLAGDFDVIRG